MVFIEVIRSVWGMYLYQLILLQSPGVHRPLASLCVNFLPPLCSLWGYMWACCLLTMESTTLAKDLLMFELNSQSNYTPPFCAPEAMCWLAGIVYGSVQANILVYCLHRSPMVMEMSWNFKISFSMTVKVMKFDFVVCMSKEMYYVIVLFHG